MKKEQKLVINTKINNLEGCQTTIIFFANAFLVCVG